MSARFHPYLCGRNAAEWLIDMGNFTFEEMNLMCIYNTGNRTGLIDSLREMRGELSPEETELRELTVAQLEKQARSGQPISLMDLAAAAHREERDKKKSVMEQLKSQPRTEHKKTAPKKSAEREL